MTHRLGNSYVVVNPNPEFQLQIGDIMWVARELFPVWFI